MRKISIITTPEMEIALASYFNYRTNLIVPNVHWGMDMHECDLLMVSRAGYCTEVEIKVSRADLKKDGEKGHGHFSNRIKYLYFALPEYLVPDWRYQCDVEFVPERAGIILVSPKDPTDLNPRCKIIKTPKPNRAATKMTDAEQYKVARLGALRIWRLKRKLLTLWN